MQYYDSIDNITDILKNRLSDKQLNIELSPYITESQLSNFKLVMKTLEYDSLSLVSWEQNFWTPEGYKRFSNFFNDQVHLKKLSLRFFVNDLDPEGSLILAQGIQKLKNIESFELLLSLCKIQDEGLNYFLNSISQLQKINHITFHFDKIKIQKVGVMNTFSTLQKISNLNSLDIIFDEEIASQSYQEISNGLLHLSNLEKLIIQIQTKTQLQIFEIVTAISKLKKLNHLLLEIQGYEDKIMEIDTQVIVMLCELQNLSTFHFYVHSYENNDLHKQKLNILNSLSSRNRIIDLKINDENRNKKNTQKIRQKAKKIKQLVLCDFYE